MSTVFEYRALIKDTLMLKLYQQQILKWNKALYVLGQKNASTYSNIDLHTIYSIQYKGHIYTPEGSDKTWLESKYVCSLNPNYSQFVEKMERIAYELNSMKTERYESERFLSGFVLFTATPATYERILGTILYSAIKLILEEHQWLVNNAEEDRSINTYARHNKFIIKTMQERLLLNLILK